MVSSPTSAKSSKAPKATLSRVSKRKQSPEEPTLPASSSNKHARSPKACERCRSKKTKCDGKTPCQRCREDSQLCCYGMRKSGGLKRPPLGYAEMLEDSNQALVSALKEMYSMFKDKMDEMELGEVRTNEKGEPIISDIVEILGIPQRHAENEATTEFPQDETELQKIRGQMLDAEDETEARKNSQSSESHSETRMKREASISSIHSATSQESHAWSNRGEINVSGRRQGGVHTDLSAQKRPVPVETESQSSIDSTSTSSAFADSPMSLTASEFETSTFGLGTTCSPRPDFNLSRNPSQIQTSQLMQRRMRSIPDVQTISHWRDNGFGFTQEYNQPHADGTIRPEMIMQQSFLSFNNMDVPLNPREYDDTHSSMQLDSMSFAWNHGLSSYS